MASETRVRFPAGANLFSPKYPHPCGTPGLQDPWRPTVPWGRALCRLPQHLAQDQTRVRRIPFLGRHPWRQSTLCLPIPTERTWKALHSNPLWSRKIPDAKPRPNSCSTASGVSLEKIFTKPTTEAVQNAHHLFALVSNPFYDIRQVRFSNDDTLEVVYANLKDNQPDNGRVNIFIAAFTTCHARRKLYSYLKQLQQRVLYFDTDSVIYTFKPGQPDIPIGDYLGEMADELDVDDADFLFVNGLCHF